MTACGGNELELLEKIEEQALFGFTGKANILLKGSKQYLGAIYQKEGQIVHATFGGMRGKNALFQVVITLFDNSERYIIVSEPEIVEDSSISFSIGYEELKKSASKHLEVHRNLLKFRPPNSIMVKANSEFLDKGSNVSPIEFDTLLLVSSSSNVDEIYEKAKMFDYFVTQSLISLRKKGAISVTSV